MDRVFGLLLLVVYVAAIVGLSSGVTFLVIKLFPVKSKSSTPDEPSEDDGGGGPVGKLFRKAKRETA